MLLNCGVREDSWTARRSNQSILKEISPEYSLEGLMLKLKLQYFGHLMQRTNPLKKTLMLGKTEGWRRREWQRIRWLYGITDVMDMSWVGSRSWWWIGKPGVLQSMGSQRVRHDWVTELNWGGASGKEPASHHRWGKRPGFNSWIRKIPGEGNGTSVFLPGEYQKSLVGYSP